MRSVIKSWFTPLKKLKVCSEKNSSLKEMTWNTDDKKQTRYIQWVIS